LKLDVHYIEDLVKEHPVGKGASLGLMSINQVMEDDLGKIEGVAVEDAINEVDAKG